jgi:hypothetical protein
MVQIKVTRASRSRALGRRSGLRRGTVAAWPSRPAACISACGIVSYVAAPSWPTVAISPGNGNLNSARAGRIVTQDGLCYVIAAARGPTDSVLPFGRGGGVRGCQKRSFPSIRHWRTCGKRFVSERSKETHRARTNGPAPPVQAAFRSKAPRMPVLEPCPPGFGRRNGAAMGRGGCFPVEHGEIRLRGRPITGSAHASSMEIGLDGRQ